MSKIESVLTDKAPKPLPQFSQAIKYNGLVYCSGNIGLHPATSIAVEGTVKDRTRQALSNLEAVLEASGSSKRNVLKVNIFITTMDDFATMNEAYDEFFSFEPKPGSFEVTVQIPSDEMTSTTQLRILRTSLRSSPFPLPLRPGYCQLHATASQRAQPRPHQPPCAPRPFSSTPCTRRKPKKANMAFTADKTAQHPDRDPLQPTQTTSPTAANPPASTRPPPLALPARDPAASRFRHLFLTGKAYLAFYKTGFKQIYINTRLVWSLRSASGIPPDTPAPGTTASPPTLRPAATTRSTELLKRRWRHDVRRLPLFAVMFVICGEFTPLVVLALPGVVPLTCRIPRQVEQLRRAAEARREASLARLQQEHDSGAPLSRAAVTAHVARSLGLVSPIWDRLRAPDSLVALLASRRVRGRVTFLDRDNHLLSQAGGVAALEDEEVALACEDRGLPVLDRSAAELRKSLGRWMALAEPDSPGQQEAGEGDSLWSPEAVAEREALMVSLLAAQKWPLERQELEALTGKVKW
ncbi:endoribonuclease l-psp [Diaporthe amygdali]|uniref:endoribonuclease l-psp n=1 Tax=Phomopsis amygdali TaxID=1214568 RepID=UPI0022FDEC8B|nr:endoribonuclease l-psp [Diaporthe amygdali]KAJ0117277.1 endoribonuclease l-psp [Diaporthe amygdali]